MIRLDPWPHIVLDDFLTAGEFKRLNHHCSKVWKGQQERIDYDYDDQVQRWHLNYDPIFQHDLKQYLKFFQHREYSKLRTFANFVKTKANFVHSTHVEAPFKILSSILYLSPEKNNGTRLFTNKDREGEVLEVEWKPNRLLIFAGQDDLTWHDYTSSDTDRYTFNHFLVDPTVIENKFYQTLHF